jgi:hypothetical protein
LRHEYEEINCLARPIQALKQFFCGINAQVAGANAFFSDVTFFNPGHFNNSFNLFT